MKVAAAKLLLLASVAWEAEAFFPSGAQSVGRTSRVCRAPIAVNYEPPSREEIDKMEASERSSSSDSGSISTSLVSVNDENLQFGAGVVGGVAGLILGGPILALIASIAANYSSKQDNEIGVVARGISKTAIDVFNFVASINSKYNISGKTGEAIAEAVGKLKESDDSKSIEKVEETVKETTSKASQLVSEYDLLNKSKQVLGTVGEIADSAISKTAELSKEYKVVDRATETIKKAVDSAKSSM